MLETASALTVMEISVYLDRKFKGWHCARYASFKTNPISLQAGNGFICHFARLFLGWRYPILFQYSAR